MTKVEQVNENNNDMKNHNDKDSNTRMEQSKDEL